MDGDRTDEACADEACIGGAYVDGAFADGACTDVACTDGAVVVAKVGRLGRGSSFKACGPIVSSRGLSFSWSFAWS